MLGASPTNGEGAAVGDTYHDPVDHLRTTRPLAGESLIDVLHWPGYLMVVAGVVAVCGAWLPSAPDISMRA